MDQTSLLAELTAEAERDGVRQFVVGAVVHHGGKVLLLKRPEDDFMGGIFEKHDDLDASGLFSQVPARWCQDHRWSGSAAGLPECPSHPSRTPQTGQDPP